MVLCPQQHTHARSYKGTHGSCFNERRGNATDRDKEDCHGVVVVLIEGPQNQAGDLEDVERVEHLLQLAGLAPSTLDGEAYLVSEKTEQGLLLNVDEVAAKNDVTVALFLAVNAGANCQDV